MNFNLPVGLWRKYVKGRTFLVELHEDGTLTEWTEDKPDDTWGGMYSSGGATKQSCWIEMTIGEHTTRIESYSWTSTLKGLEDDALDVSMKLIGPKA